MPLPRPSGLGQSGTRRGNGTHDRETDREGLDPGPGSNSTTPTMNPPIRANTLTTDVLMPIPYLRHLSSDGHSSSFPLRLLRGSFPDTSSGRLRRTLTKVRLNRSQGHRPKGRFWWFIGVYSRSTAHPRPSGTDDVPTWGVSAGRTGLPMGWAAISGRQHTFVGSSAPLLYPPSGPRAAGKVCEARQEAIPRIHRALEIIWEHE